MSENEQEEDPELDSETKFRKDIEMRGQIQEKKYKKQEVGEETAGDFSVIVDPYLWK